MRTVLESVGAASYLLPVNEPSLKLLWNVPKYWQMKGCYQCLARGNTNEEYIHLLLIMEILHPHIGLSTKAIASNNSHTPMKGQRDNRLPILIPLAYSATVILGEAAVADWQGQ